MNRLRQDLFERRLWPVVVILVLAIVAIPVFLGRRTVNASTTGVPPVPAVASALISAARAPQSRSEAVSQRLLITKVMRDPFAAGASRLTAKAPSQMSQPSSTPTPSAAAPVATIATASSPFAGSASASASSSPVSTGTPSSPVGAASTPTTVAALSGAAAAQAGTAPATRTVTVTRTVTTTTPSPTQPVGPTSWTVYRADVSVSTDGAPAVTRTNIERLTPLPSPATPEAMFDGVTAGGSQVVFTLGAGVHATGAAFCRPNHALCQVIVLPNGASEQLSFTAATGEPATMDLSVTHIFKTVIHSRAAALAAVERQSTAGACEVSLASPVVWTMTSHGAFITSAHVPTLCMIPGDLVPFPGIAATS